jgi:hypothetical protein
MFEEKEEFLASYLLILTDLQLWKRRVKVSSKCKTKTK